MPYVLPEDKAAWRKRTNQSAKTEEWKKNNPDKVASHYAKSLETYRIKSAANISAGLRADGKPRKERSRKSKEELELRRIQREQDPEWQARRIESQRRSGRKYHQHPRNRIKRRIRSQIWKQLNGERKSDRTMHIVGCSADDLIKHLESTMPKGMTWDDYGPRMHIDHRMPCKHFNLTDPKELKLCWHFSNLRLYPADKNMSEQDRRGEHHQPPLGI